MALSNAERQAAYRARRKAEAAAPKLPAPVVKPDLEDRLRDLLARNEALEEEVRRLKQELARRPPVMVTSPPVLRRIPEIPQHRFGQSRPAPKPGPSRSNTSARGRAG